MSEQGKYGEPWRVVDLLAFAGSEEELRFFAVHDSSGNNAIGSADEGSLHDAEEAVYARVVACVNACVGMKDPAAEITALREEIERLRGEVRDAFREGYWYGISDGHPLSRANEGGRWGDSNAYDAVEPKS